eukprot:COSAG02_NODE_2932_length_7712_cov_2.172468_6_plen_43_part_00
MTLYVLQDEDGKLDVRLEAVLQGSSQSSSYLALQLQPRGTHG